MVHLQLIKLGISVHEIVITQSKNNITIEQFVNSKRSYFRASKELTSEPELIELIDELEPDQIFFDVGANVGTYSLYAGMKALRVIAVEPNFANSYLLTKNIWKNQLQNRIQNLKIGLSNYTGVNSLIHHKSIEGGNSAASIYGDGFFSSEMPEFFREVTLVYKLDDITKLLGLIPSLIKIDTDGNELQVLQGGGQTLESPIVKKLLVEISSELEQISIVNFLKNYNFTLDKTFGKSSDGKIFNLIFKRDLKETI